MAKKKITRKELLKDTDEFFSFSAKAANFVTGHLSEIKFVGVALLIIAVGLFFSLFSLSLLHKKKYQKEKVPTLWIKEQHL